MTERTICPACGAPLEYSPEDDNVRCGFCGAGFDVAREGDQTRLQMTSQPRPQQEELSERSRREIQEVEDEAAEDLAETYPGTIHEAEGEPMAPSYISAAAEDVTADEALPDIDLPPQTEQKPPAELPQYPYTVGPTTPASGGNRNRYVAMGVSVFVAACLICLCLAGAAVVIYNTTGGQLTF